MCIRDREGNSRTTSRIASVPPVEAPIAIIGDAFPAETFGEIREEIWLIGCLVGNVFLTGVGIEGEGR